MSPGVHTERPEPEERPWIPETQHKVIDVPQQVGSPRRRGLDHHSNHRSSTYTKVQILLSNTVATGRGPAQCRCHGDRHRIPESQQIVRLEKQIVEMFECRRRCPERTPSPARRRWRGSAGWCGKDATTRRSAARCFTLPSAASRAISSLISGAAPAEQEGGAAIAPQLRFAPLR